MENKILIDSVNNLKVALNEISVYDFDVYTSMELYYKIAENFNKVIRELSRFEGVISEEIVKQNEKLIYLLGEGLNKEVVNKIDNMVEKGIFDTIINHNIFNKLKNDVDNLKIDINNVNSQLKDIANKGTTVEVLERVTKEEIERQITDGTIANLTIKDNSITNSKIKDSEIKPNKTSFIKYTKNIFDKDSIVQNSFLDAITGNEIYNDRGWRTTPFIEVEENTLYTTNFDIFNRNSFEYDENYNMIRKFSEQVDEEIIEQIYDYILSEDAKSRGIYN